MNMFPLICLRFIKHNILFSSLQSKCCASSLQTLFSIWSILFQNTHRQSNPAFTTPQPHTERERKVKGRFTYRWSDCTSEWISGVPQWAFWYPHLLLVMRTRYVTARTPSFACRNWACVCLCMCVCVCVMVFVYLCMWFSFLQNLPYRNAMIRK